MINALLNILLTLVIAIFVVICVAVLIGVFLLAIGMISAICRGLKGDDEDDEDKPSAAQELERFLNYVEACTQEYRLAYDAVNQEDRRLQDLVHDMEFARDKAERNRIATRLHNSRVLRKQNKDIVKRDEGLVKFFEDQNHKATLNKMRQLLGKQRKEEEYLAGERTYKPRIKD